MADAKLSSYPVVTTVNAVDYLPTLQGGANKLMTVGQLKAFSNALTDTSIVSAIIPLSYDVVGISGNCTLPNAVVTTRLSLVASDIGSVTIATLNTGFNFVTGNTLDVLWVANKWHIMSIQGMTPI